MAELTHPPRPGGSERHALRSAALVLGGAALFGTVGTAQRLGPDVPAPELAAVRLAAAAALLLGAAVLSGHAGALSRMVRQSPVWWAGAGQAGFNLCFLGAIRETGVAVGTLVAIGATPLVTGLVTRHASRRWLLATGVATTGLVLLVGGQLLTQPAGSATVTVTGVLLALGASVSYATYILAGDAAAERRLETQPYLAVAFTVAALVAAPLLGAGDLGWLTHPDAVALVAYLAVFPTLVAYSLFNRGLHGVRPGTAATLGLVEPVVAALLAYAVLGERLSAPAAAGAVLVLVGLLLVVRAAGARTGPREGGPGTAGREQAAAVKQNARRA